MKVLLSTLYQTITLGHCIGSPLLLWLELIAVLSVLCSQWLQLLAGGVLVLSSVVGLVLFGVFSSLDTNKKILIICCVAICEAIVMK